MNLPTVQTTKTAAELVSEVLDAPKLSAEMFRKALAKLERGDRQDLIENEADYWRMLESEREWFKRSLEWSVCNRCETGGYLHNARWGFENYVRGKGWV